MSAQGNAGVHPGPGWRLLTPLERIERGDQQFTVCQWHSASEWIGYSVMQAGGSFRRRLLQPSPAPAASLSAQIRALPCDGAEQYGDGDLESAMHTGFLQGHQRALEAAAELAATAEVRIAELETLLWACRDVLTRQSADCDGTREQIIAEVARALAPTKEAPNA